MSGRRLGKRCASLVAEEEILWGRLWDGASKNRLLCCCRIAVILTVGRPTGVTALSLLLTPFLLQASSRILRDQSDHISVQFVRPLYETYKTLQMT